MKKRISRREFVQTTSSFGAILFLPSVNLLYGENVLPKVLIIGDSISIGYTPFVKEILTNKAYVWHPDENCEGTTKGLTKIDEWIGTTKWDLIHFNFGLHDIKHVNAETGVNSNLPEDPRQSDLKQYVKNLIVIVRRLKKTDANLIYATITPVPDISSPFRLPQDVITYNLAAIRIMEEERIVVNDMYGFALPKISEIQLPNNVHFKSEGYKFLAERVSRHIDFFLDSP